MSFLSPPDVAATPVAPEPPPAPPPPDDLARRRKMEQKYTAQTAKSGRASTILTKDSDESLG